jgi:hypothetical protein
VPSRASDRILTHVVATPRQAGNLIFLNSIYITSFLSAQLLAAPPNKFLTFTFVSSSANCLFSPSSVNCTFSTLLYRSINPLLLQVTFLLYLCIVGLLNIILSNLRKCSPKLFFSRSYWLWPKPGKTATV